MGAGLFLGGRYLIKKYKANKADENTANDAENLATRLNQAIAGPGSNEEEVYRVLRQVTDWPAVVQAYRAKYGASLVDDLQGDLSVEEYRQAAAIINALKDGGKAGDVPFFPSAVEVLRVIPGPYWPTFAITQPNSYWAVRHSGRTESHWMTDYYIFNAQINKGETVKLAIKASDCELRTAEALMKMRDAKQAKNIDWIQAMKSV